MENETLYLWSETIPNWVMALSAASAAIVFLWRRQDRKEARAAKESTIKNGVNAGWVTARFEDSEREKWGLLITNGMPSPITDIRVTCSGNSESEVLAHPTVQPGTFFFESLKPGGPRAWGLPTKSFTSFEYITASKKHTTKLMTFSYSGASYTKETAQQAS